MCEFSDVHNYSFRWITYLVLITGIYTFIHWFVVTPLTYSHIYECCNETWPRDWVVWFLAASFVTWCVITILILLLWLCARRCCGEKINESNIQLTEVKDAGKKAPSDMGGISLPFPPENESPTTEYKVAKKEEESKTEMVVLPDMTTAWENLTVVNVNNVKSSEESNPPKANFVIPVDETRHFLQKKETTEKKKAENSVPLKSPREIFFKDLIEAAANSPNHRNSYFDFDPNKFSLEEDKPEKEETKSSETDNTFFIGSRDNSSTVTSEVYVALDERGAVQEQTVMGEFRILK